MQVGEGRGLAVQGVDRLIEDAHGRSLPRRRPVDTQRMRCAAPAVAWPSTVGEYSARYFVMLDVRDY